MLTYPKDHVAYTPAVKTDVMKTWLKHGFKKPTQSPEYQAKWNYYKSLGSL
jgi:hypothetical protein